jgi:putative Ca2+/H+ antiporter (TMEM165/GDT1 family)
LNVGLAAATFAVVIPAELPDKTFISCVVLGSRHRPVPVWIGAVAALVLQAGVAVLAGRLLRLLPHRSVDGVVAVVFFAAACYLFLSSEVHAEVAGEKIALEGEVLAERDAARDLGAGDHTVGDPTAAGSHAAAGGHGAAGDAGGSGLRIAVTTFAVVAVAEVGDLTQVVIANISARYGDPVSVFAGAAVAFLLVSALAVVLGRTLTRFVPLTLVRRGSGVVLAALGVWSAANALGG